MFPKFKLNLPNSVLRAARNIPKRVMPEFRRELQTKVKPALQRQVDDLLGADPGPVKRPFVFSDDPVQNARIRAAYFATNGFGKGIPYRRTNNLRTSWVVKLSSKLQKEFVTVVNLKSYAKYVYGPRQVPGHKRTGWGKDFDEAVALIEEDGIVMVVAAWKRSILKTLKAA